PHGPRANLLDDDGRRQAAELAAIFQRAPLRVAEEKSACKEIASARRVDHVGNLEGIDLDAFLAPNEDSAFFAEGDGRELAVGGNLFQCQLEVFRLVKRQSLLLVGKDDIDGSRAHQVEELGAVAS